MDDVSPGLSVTLSAALYAQLCAEASRLDVPLEWLVASLIVDTVSEDAPAITSARGAEPRRPASFNARLPARSAAG